MTAIHLTLIDLDTATARALGRCNALPGTAVTTVRPDTRRPGWLARDLMASVGIRHGISGQTRHDTDDRQLAPIWLAAHGITDLLIVGIEGLSASLLCEGIELATLAGTDLWLLADHQLPDSLIDVLGDWPVVPVPPAAFVDRWVAAAPAAANTTRAPAPSDGLPEAVPHVDFPLFRATARRQLPADQFAAVDQRFLSELQVALHTLAAGTAPTQALRDALTRCQSATAVVVTVRAVQAAAWRQGHHVRVDLHALLAFDDHVPVAAVTDPETWARLHAYRQPWRQACCVLALLDVDLATQLTLTLDDLDVDRPALHVGEGWTKLPEQARPALGALQASRLAVGATGTDLLLAKVDGSAVTSRTLADAIKAVQKETGLRLTGAHVERTAVPTGRWARRRHVAATPMEV